MGKVPSCGHWAGGGGAGGEGNWDCRGLAAGRGHRKGRNYSETLPPMPMRPKAQTANDHPVCQAKMFPVQPG